MNREYNIDLRGVCSREELHDRIEEELPVPGWYGRNLDALYDILTVMVLVSLSMVRCFCASFSLR